MIKKICKSSYHSHEVQRCEENLNNLETISREAEEVCQRVAFDDESDRKKCEKTAEICEKALKACESHHGIRSDRCQEKRDTCQTRVHNIHSLRKKLQKMGHNSQLNRLNIKAAVKGRSGQLSVQTSISFGQKTEENGYVVKYFAGAEIEIPHKSAEYEVSVEGKVVLPRISNRWATKQLLEEELKMEVEGKIKAGRKDNLKEVSFKTIMEKSEEQKESIRKSPEYLKCSEHEQQDNILSSTCMKVRHQAASTDKTTLIVELPKELDQEPAVLKIEEYIKAYFISQISVHHDSSVSSPKELKVVLDISRAGDEAQLKVERSGHKWVVKNIRLPQYAKGIVPMSLSNRPAQNILQKLTHNQAPASCRIEPSYVSTFDNKTIRYEMNDCMHLLFKDRSGKIPVAVLARSQSGPKSSKVIEILSGVSKVVLKPKSDGALQIDLKIQNEKKEIELTKGQVHYEKCPESGEVLIEMKRFADNVYNIWFRKEMLQVPIFTSIF